MKQNPRDVINDVREQVRSTDTNHKILANYSTDPELWGYSKVWLLFALLPALIMVKFSTSYLTGRAKFYGYVGGVVLAALGVAVTVATPDSMDAQGYFSALVSQYTRQNHMIHDTDPDTTRLAQPANDSLFGRFVQLPLVRQLPYVGAERYGPTQDLVAHERPYRGEYAIQRDDGALIAAIRIRPIPLRRESRREKRKVTRAVADALEAAVDYDAQWYSPTRATEFADRRTEWATRARALQNQAQQCVSTPGTASPTNAIRKQILADVCSEHAAVINLYENTKRVREYYMLVSVDPGEVVIERSSEEGGLGVIPGIGWLVEQKRLREQAGSPEHVTAMLRKLERRATTLSNELSRVEGMTTIPLSSVEFSEHVADYYRGVNVRAQDDFTDSVRSTPVPAGPDAGDPEHEVSYGHITNRPQARDSSAPDATTPDGGTISPVTPTTETPPSSTANQPSASEASEETTNRNDNVLVGIADDDDDLAWQYKCVLAPNEHKRTSEHCVIDETYYSKTLEIRDWPSIPVHGFLDPVASFTMPGIDITITTHLTGEDSRKAERELSEAADSIKDKVRSFATSEWMPDLFAEKAARKLAEVKSIQQTIAASEYSLYSSQTFLEVRAPDEDLLETAVSRLRSRLQDVSADAKILNNNHRRGYQTVAPACQNVIGGNTKMTGDGLARLVPWTARNLIEPGGIELGINQDTGDPIVLNLLDRETGYNVGIWATIGGGKTTTMTRLLMRSKLRNPEMPVVIIDPMEEYAGLTELFGGERVVVGSDTGINPLQIEPTPREKLKVIGEESPKRQAVRRSMDFVRSYYDYMDIPFDEKQGTWRIAIKEAYARRGITSDPSTHDRDSPTLRDDVFPIFEEMVNTPNEYLPDALEDVAISQDELKKHANAILMNDVGALRQGGEFEHLSKATEIEIEDIEMLYLDLQQYESESTAGLMMGPLITAVYEEAKALDEPMLFALDEFHYMLRNSSNLETLKQFYRHSRHSDLSIITATQSVSEFFTKTTDGETKLTDNAEIMTDLMSVKIFHYLQEMDDEWAAEFDLSSEEQEYVANAATGDPTAQALLQVDKEGSFALDVNFSHELNPREFAVNQYDSSDHGEDFLRYLADYTDRNGNDVAEWTWTNTHRSSRTGTQTGLSSINGTTTNGTASTEDDVRSTVTEVGQDD